MKYNHIPLIAFTIGAVLVTPYTLGETVIIQKTCVGQCDKRYKNQCGETVKIGRGDWCYDSSHTYKCASVYPFDAPQWAILNCNLQQDWVTCADGHSMRIYQCKSYMPAGGDSP